MKNEAQSGREKLRDLLRRIPAMERWEPVSKELDWVLRGRPNPAEHKQLLPDYCYQILDVWRRTLFKDLPALASIVSCGEAGPPGAKPIEGTKPVVQVNWRLYGRVVGLGLRCSRFWELEAVGSMERAGLSDMNPNEEKELSGLLTGGERMEEKLNEMV